MGALGAVGALALVGGCGTTPPGDGGGTQSAKPTAKATPKPSASPASRLSLPAKLTDDAICGLVSEKTLKGILGRPSEQGGSVSSDPMSGSTEADCEWRNTTAEGEGAGKQRNLTITVRRYKDGEDPSGKKFTAVQWAQGDYYSSFQAARENEGDTEKLASVKTTYGEMNKIPWVVDQNFVIYDKSVSSLQRNGGVTVHIQVGDSTVTISYRGYDQAPGGAAYDGSGNKPMSYRTARAGGVDVARDIMSHVVKG